MLVDLSSESSEVGGRKHYCVGGLGNTCERLVVLNLQKMLADIFWQKIAMLIT